jgi:hypothetical protein
MTDTYIGLFGDVVELGSPMSALIEAAEKVLPVCYEDGGEICFGCSKSGGGHYKGCPVKRLENAIKSARGAA